MPLGKLAGGCWEMAVWRGAGSFVQVLAEYSFLQPRIASGTGRFPSKHHFCGWC